MLPPCAMHARSSKLRPALTRDRPTEKPNIACMIPTGIPSISRNTVGQFNAEHASTLMGRARGVLGFCDHSPRSNPPHYVSLRTTDAQLGGWGAVLSEVEG